MNWLDQIHVGDCRALMRKMIADGVRVQCIVTSPPYWGLRDYGTGTWRGGTDGCDHSRTLGGTKGSTLDQYDNGLTSEAIAKKVARYGRASYLDRCGKCGAMRVDEQYGLERTWQRHVARMRSVFRLARALLAEDGVLFLNYGDSYYTPRPNGGIGSNSLINGQRSQEEFRKASRCMKSRIQPPDVDGPNRRRQSGLKPKDLVGMPWRIAFTLQADGWYLRSDIIWHKPNPMPESVTDRPTKAHEYLFLLARSERYYYDQEGTKEPATGGAHPRRAQTPVSSWATGDTPHNAIDFAKAGPKDTARKAQGLRDSTKFGRGAGFRKLGATGSGVKNNASQDAALSSVVETRNMRTVWTIPTEPFGAAHFATFPRDLVRRCILAGSRPGDVVLDPFMGSGTVAQVADELGRRWIGCELNESYARMYGRDRPAQLGAPL